MDVRGPCYFRPALKRDSQVQTYSKIPRRFQQRVPLHQVENHCKFASKSPEIY
jgi:hypothetical protein